MNNDNDNDIDGNENDDKDNDYDKDNIDVDDDDDDFFIQSPDKRKYKRKRILSPSVCAVLDRTNTSVQKGTMVMASVINRAGSSTSSTVLSKSTIHRKRQRQREITGTAIKENYVPATCIVHWNSKLMPESSNK